MHRVSSDCTLQETDDDVSLFDLDFAGTDGTSGGVGGTFSLTPRVSFSEESERFEEEDCDVSPEESRFEFALAPPPPQETDSESGGLESSLEEDERWESAQSLSNSRSSSPLLHGYFGDTFEPRLSPTPSVSTLTLTTEEDWRDDGTAAFESVAEYAGGNLLDQSSSSSASTKRGSKMRSLVVKSRRDDELVFVDL
ncbi:hypothetical protein HDU98_008331 [Podochytrium sp. JEL0797]|nr:hypothetical protein HDU98_008331 [Podochytrium sp. JEL0797]